MDGIRIEAELLAAFHLYAHTYAHTRSSHVWCTDCDDWSNNVIVFNDVTM